MVVLIAESLNVMSKTIGPALRAREAKPVQDMAQAEAAAGADYIDINIGPARKAGDELMAWVAAANLVEREIERPPHQAVQPKAPRRTVDSRRHRVDVDTVMVRNRRQL